MSAVSVIRMNLFDRTPKANTKESISTIYTSIPSKTSPLVASASVMGMPHTADVMTSIRIDFSVSASITQGEITVKSAFPFSTSSPGVQGASRDWDVKLATVMGKQQSACTMPQ